MFAEKKKIHFIGIGGSGMSGIALILRNMGFTVTGSDLRSSTVTNDLEKKNIRIRIGHRRENIGNADAVVYSSAVLLSNPEILEAQKRGIPVIKRAEMLYEISRLKYGIAVAGTHGKTSTTSMLAHILREAGLSPSCVVGGRAYNIKGHSILGYGRYLVFEADESDGSFLRYFPIAAVVTNIDNDHLDFFGDMENLKKAFLEFINRVPFYGLAVLCADDPVLRTLFPYVTKKFASYGIDRGDFTAGKIKYLEKGVSYSIYEKGEKYCDIFLPMFGRHNVLNSLAAAVLAKFLGVGKKEIARAFETFTGIGRRLEKKGEKKGISFYDDYGHHPTEIRNTLKALRQSKPRGRIIAIFQPHRFSRTRLLYRDFAACFGETDLLYIMDIYPAGEKAVRGVSSGLIYKLMRKKKRPLVKLMNDRRLIAGDIFQKACPGDCVITIGAGDIIKFYETEFLFSSEKRVRQ